MLWSALIRQTEELPASASPDLLAIAVASAAIVLAIITLFYMLETRKMRLATEKMVKASQQPSFALEPNDYLGILGQKNSDNFTMLYLVNHGATATDITARCMWLDSENSGGSSKTFYILSLAKHGYAALDVPVQAIVSQRKFIKVEITCKDAAGEPYHAFVTNGLDKIRGTDTTMAYQNSIWFAIYDALNKISQKVK